MKKIFTLITGFLSILTVWSQAPEKISYQAVIRNTDNELVTNQNISVQISILQNSAEGASVYTETHNPTTNSNGLVTLEIGSGTTTGDFSAIEWADGTYFIKTETDPAGGTNYTITGTSQILSVPYALHAKTAAEYTSSVARGITATDTANWNKLTTYSVGDYAQGGVVFWIDKTGQHGLVCAKEDQSTGVRWEAGTHGYTQAKGDGPYAGEANTSIIIAALVAIGDDGSTYAARICNELQITEGGKTYGDWYLPSKEELNLMYQNKATIDATAVANGGSSFASVYYWSSTEHNISSVWVQIFDSGMHGNSSKNTTTNRVRAVRAF